MNDSPANHTIIATAIAQYAQNAGADYVSYTSMIIDAINAVNMVTEENQHEVVVRTLDDFIAPIPADMIEDLILKHTLQLRVERRENITAGRWGKRFQNGY